MMIDALLTHVRAYATSPGMNARSLATAAGLPYTTVIDALRPGSNPTAATLRKLEAVIPDEFDAKSHL